MVMPFDGGPQEQAPRAQRVLVEHVDGQHVVRAGHPARRGHRAVGDRPVGRADRRDRAAGVAHFAHAGVRGDRQPSAHRPVRVGPADESVPSPATCGT